MPNKYRLLIIVAFTVFIHALGIVKFLALIVCIGLITRLLLSDRTVLGLMHFNSGFRLRYISSLRRVVWARDWKDNDVVYIDRAHIDAQTRKISIFAEILHDDRLSGTTH
jgi:hypothetical protein